MADERKSSQARIDANARYNKKTYERIPLDVRFDSNLNGDAIRSHAAAMGESLNSFLKRAIAETMARDKDKQTEVQQELSD